MPVKVELLPNEPIIIATFIGKVSLDDIREIFVQSAELIKDLQGTIYRITDASGVDISFMDLLSGVQIASQGLPGSTTDPRIKPSFVGSDSMVRLAADMLQRERYGGVKMPIFRSLDDALTAVRIQITNERSSVQAEGTTE